MTTPYHDHAQLLIDWLDQQGLEPPEAMAVLGIALQGLCFACAPRRAQDVANEFIKTFNETMRRKVN